MRKILFIIFVPIFFLGCQKDEVITPDESGLKPPQQKNEIDLIGFAGHDIKAIAVNVKEPNNILISTAKPGKRIYISSNYGLSWSIAKDSFYSLCLSFDLHKPSNIYIAHNSDRSYALIPPLLLKSNDYGQTWVSADSGILVGAGERHITTISMDYFNQNFIYLVATANFNIQPSSSFAYFSQTFISTNGGVSFSQDIDINILNSIGWVFVGDFATSNLKTGTIYAAIIGDNNNYDIAESSDFGVSWTAKNIIDNWYSDFIRVYNNFVILKVTDYPRLNKELIYKYKGKILLSKDFGNSFTILDTNLIDYSDVNDMLITPEGYIIFTATLNSDPSKSTIYISKDGGISWQNLVNNDFDSKTLLAYDSKNKFLYVVKDRVNKGLYRIKLN